MAVQIVPNAGTLTLNWSGESRVWTNVFGLIGTPSLPVFDQTLANAIFTSIRGAAATATYMSKMASTVTLESVSIRSLAAANLAEFTSVGTPLAGGGTLDALPLSVAFCVTERTNLAGKRFRGRKYFSGFDESCNDASGRIDPTIPPIVLAFWDAIFSAVSSHTMALAIVGRPTDAVTIPAKTIPARSAIVNQAISRESRNLKWESQRQRTGRQ